MGDSGRDDSTILRHLETIPQRLEYISKTHPHRDLFVACSTESRDVYTAGRLLDLAGKFAGQLVDHGFKPGDILANTVSNSPERLITDLGAILAGCPVVAMSPTFADGTDLLHTAARSRFKGIILCPEEWSLSWKILGKSVADQSGVFSGISAKGLEDLTTVVMVRPRTSDRPFLHALAELSPRPDATHQARAEDLTYIFCSSGSTGLPKLIPKTHRDLLETGARNYPSYERNVFHSNRGVVFFDDRPLGWVGGFPFTTYAFGDTRVTLDTLTSQDNLSPGQLTEIIVREKCNLGLMLPNKISQLSSHVTEVGLNRNLFKTLIVGGYPITQTQANLAMNLTDELAVLYGSSETLFVSVFIYCQDHGVFRDYCCGKPFDGIQICVVDDAGHEGVDGTIGKILIKGTSFSGYLNRQQNPDPDTVKTLLPDGWVDLGDYGYISQEDGSLHIMGRMKDVIYSPIIFYPGVLESKIQSHPDVLEALVLPVTGKGNYNGICACVKTADQSGLDEERLKDFCDEILQTKDATGPKPKYFMVLRGPDFPLQATGKPDRKKLTAMAEKMFGNN